MRQRQVAWSWAVSVLTALAGGVGVRPTQGLIRQRRGTSISPSEIRRRARRPPRCAPMWRDLPFAPVPVDLLVLFDRSESMARGVRGRDPIRGGRRAAERVAARIRGPNPFRLPGIPVPGRLPGRICTGAAAPSRRRWRSGRGPAAAIRPAHRRRGRRWRGTPPPPRRCGLARRYFLELERRRQRPRSAAGHRRAPQLRHRRPAARARRPGAAGRGLRGRRRRGGRPAGRRGADDRAGHRQRGGAPTRRHRALEDSTEEAVTCLSELARRGGTARVDGPPAYYVATQPAGAGAQPAAIFRRHACPRACSIRAEQGAGRPQPGAGAVRRQADPAQPPRRLGLRVRPTTASASPSSASPAGGWIASR